MLINYRWTEHRKSSRYYVEKLVLFCVKRLGLRCCLVLLEGTILNSIELSVVSCNVQPSSPLH